MAAKGIVFLDSLEKSHVKNEGNLVNVMPRKKNC